MTEFLFGYFSGIATALIAAILISLTAATARACRETEQDPESQDDIRLTKIKSTYMRVYRND